MHDVSRQTPIEYFRTALLTAMERERVSVDVSTEYYLAQLLLSQIADGFHPDETLSDRFVKARTATTHERIRMFRDVGDRALIACGLWWEHQYRPRRVSHTQFHIQLGKSAYRGIGGHPFGELSTKFERLVDALIRFGTDASLVNARDVLRLYSLWEDSHSVHAARVLAERGIFVSTAQTTAPS